MRSWWSEPYLWVHLAGIAAVPIFLELCLLGLATSETRLPSVLVFLLVAVAGIGPIVWMQWQRPFYIFSLLPLVLKPAQLTESQRRLLRRFKAPLGRVIALILAIAAAILLWKLQQWVPTVAAMTGIVPGGAIGGLLLAMAAFLFSNLFLQVPASVLAVLVTPDAVLNKAEPYAVSNIASDFSLLGIPVKQILPPVQAASPSDAVAPSPSAPPAPPAPAAPQVETAANLEPDVWDEDSEQPADLEESAESTSTLIEAETVKGDNSAETAEPPIGISARLEDPNEVEELEESEESTVAESGPEPTIAEATPALSTESAIAEELSETTAPESQAESATVEHPVDTASAAAIPEVSIPEPAIEVSEQPEVSDSETPDLIASPDSENPFEAAAVELSTSFPNVENTIVSIVPTSEAPTSATPTEKDTESEQASPIESNQPATVEDTVVYIIPDSVEPIDVEES